MGKIHGDQKKENGKGGKPSLLSSFFSHAGYFRGFAWAGRRRRAEEGKNGILVFYNTFRVMCMIKGSGLGEWRQFSKR